MRIILLICAAIVVLGGFWLWSNTENTIDQNGLPNEGAVSVSGQIVCLPHKDTSGPQTLECAYGLLGDDGNHYALRTTGTSPSDAITRFPTGTHIEASGTLTLEEGDVYATIGVIEVEAIVPLEDNALAPSEAHSDGTLTFSIPEGFGLAVSEEQILVPTTIPPCEPGFKYCIYYLGSEYEDTNFESAGVGIVERPELTDEQSCLTTPPDGYANKTPSATTTQASYAMSMFDEIGNAGAGHYTTGQVYRLNTDNTCYQIETRIGETQFENYPEGGITEFSAEDRAALARQLQDFVQSMSLDSTGEQLVLPRN